MITSMQSRRHGEDACGRPDHGTKGGTQHAPPRHDSNRELGTNTTFKIRETRPRHGIVSPASFELQSWVPRAMRRRVLSEGTGGIPPGTRRPARRY
jgi:hypothetical protein